MKMPMRAEFERGGGGIGGQFHGGPIAALIDTVGDFAVAVVVKVAVFRRSISASTTCGRRPARFCWRRRAHAADRPCTVGVVDIDIFDDQSRLTAIGRGCYGAQPG